MTNDSESGARHVTFFKFRNPISLLKHKYPTASTVSKVVQAKADRMDVAYRAQLIVLRLRHLIFLSVG